MEKYFYLSSAEVSKRVWFATSLVKANGRHFLLPLYALRPSESFLLLIPQLQLNTCRFENSLCRCNQVP